MFTLSHWSHTIREKLELELEWYRPATLYTEESATAGTADRSCRTETPINNNKVMCACKARAVLNYI